VAAPSLLRRSAAGARSGDFAPFSLEQLARLLLRARVAAFVARVELLTQKMIDNKV